GPAASFNVGIRTVVLDTRTRTAEYGVGGGITFDSSAAGEYQETLTKARVLGTRRPSFELYETMRHDPVEGFRDLDWHLERLRGSARYFGFDHDESVIRRELERAAERFPDGPVRVRLLLGRRLRLRIEHSPFVAGAREPVRVAMDRGEPVDPSDVFLFHKTTLRGRYDAA